MVFAQGNVLSPSSHPTLTFFYLPLQLHQVLLYHVLGSEVRSRDLSDRLNVTTLNGEDVKIENTDPPRINCKSNILIADELFDIEADDGVIHGIIRLQTPVSVSFNIVDIAVGNDQFSILVAAVTAAGLGDALSGEGPFTVFGKHHYLWYIFSFRFISHDLFTFAD